ncbi:MAG: pyridoxal phosphate-dependent aminotransferase [SAR324 cluster bacterium]|nr:pyridoxal phosphate-dependent aminotransferase [SAR324 cluster bacterium]MCZ6645103.1 pyridoxal phosphate-dependent aminotransferase [SAR324 cluster bacterium]
MPPVSKRTESLGTEHAFVVLAEVNRLIAEGKPVISFAIGQPDYVTPGNIIAAAKKAMDDGQTGYTASAGIPELREAVAAYLSRTRHLDISADSVTVAGGAKPFIMYTIAAVTDHGQGHEVLYPSPGFPIYESQITACGAVPVALPLLEREAFSFDLETLRELLSPRTRLLILNSPHNPTGRTLSRQELEAIAELLRPYPDLWIFSDEVYSQMVHDGEFASIASVPGMQERTVILDGASKSYAMTGWRLGYAANETLAPHFSTWITNTESCASSISQWAGVEALTGPQDDHRNMMESFSRRRNLILEGLNSLEGIDALRPGGAFYVWPNVSELCRMVGAANAEELRKRWLHEAGVAVLADQQFGTPNAGEGHFLRFSYATSEENIAAGLERLTGWIAKAKQ